ncbi:BppU family phage baseplate upper protein, partial [Eubacterium callanderi]|uniref:BppU family phage baseplate upper protein n=1 Tax=Eubacterium callanderi TaxID=53442 RepID=UPI0034A34E49
MNTLYHDIVIDLAHMGFPESVTVKQYDDQIPHVRVELRQNGVKYVIPSGTTLRMQGTKPDKTHFMYDAIRTDDGRIDCPLTNQILAAEGPILAEIRLTDTTGELATFNFYILAQKAALSREDIESSDDYQSIDKIKADTLQYKKDAEAAKATAEAAKEAAAGSANTATQQAQTAQLEAQKVKQIVAGNEAYTKTESDLKYTVAPRKEASSDTGELKLTDADDGLSYLELQGNSEQYTNTANKNLIDLHFATDGYYVNNVNGALAVNPNYKASGYINVIPGESYFLTNASQASPGAMYNANKVYVQGVVNGLNVIPEGVKYVRISATIAGSTQFEKGTQGTEIVIGAVDTPSPDYPSEVRSVGDIPKDVNGVEIRNLLDEEWIKSQPESAWTKDSSGTVFSIEVALPKTRLYIRTPDFNATDAEGTTFGISKRPGSLAAVDGIYFYKTTLGSFDFSGQEHIYIILGRQDKNWDLAKKSLMKSRLMVTSAAEIDEYRPYIGENNGLVKLESIGVNHADTGDGPISMASVNSIEVNSWTPRRIVLTQKNKNPSWAYVKLNVERGKNYTFYCKAKVEVIEGTQTDGITKIGFR